MKIFPDKSILPYSDISNTTFKSYPQTFNGYIQFCSLNDEIYRTYKIKNETEAVIIRSGDTAHIHDNIVVRDIPCEFVYIEVPCPCESHSVGQACNCYNKPFAYWDIYCLGAGGFTNTGGGDYDDFVPNTNNGGSNNGGGGSGGEMNATFSQYNAAILKQIKQFIVRFKQRNHYTLSEEQIYSLISSCFTIDTDYDLVTFDDSCAENAMPYSYLQLIDYDGNLSTAVSWLSSHILDLNALLLHFFEHQNLEYIAEYHSAVTDLLDNDEGYVRERFFELLDAVEADPHVLLRPCVEQNTSYPYTFWSDLYNFTPDQSTMTVLANRGFSYQPLQAGNAVATSVDYYYIEIDQMPDFNGDGSPDSEQQVIDVLRANFAELASGEDLNFDFSCPALPSSDRIWWEFKPYTPEIDNVQWQFPSPHYKNTVFFIDAGAGTTPNNWFSDKGAIVISQSSPYCWIGSTINTPLSGSQPFSGQRQWGLTTLPNGKKAFYTKAADRALTPALLQVIGAATDNCDDDTYYDIAIATWKNMMLEIGALIVQYGGQMVSEPGYTQPAIYVTKTRLPYTELNAKLKSSSPVNFINCD